MFLDKIYENEIPEIFRNRKLFERSIKLVILKFGLYASNTKLVELLYICVKTWLEISIVNEF